MPSETDITDVQTDWAANLAFWLLDQTGSICGRWAGRLSAAEQRALFGHFLGRGHLVIDGSREEITHSRSICFGTDFDINHRIPWRSL